MTRPTIQFVVIGPVTDPTSLAVALAAMPISEFSAPAEPDDPTMVRIDTAAGRQQLLLTPQAA